MKKEKVEVSVVIHNEECDPRDLVWSSNVRLYFSTKFPNNSKEDDLWCEEIPSSILDLLNDEKMNYAFSFSRHYFENKLDSEGITILNVNLIIDNQDEIRKLVSSIKELVNDLDSGHPHTLSVEIGEGNPILVSLWDEDSNSNNYWLVNPDSQEVTSG